MRTTCRLCCVKLEMHLGGPAGAVEYTNPGRTWGWKYAFASHRHVGGV